jgi:capsular exopolysaccharide synthesis family protein
VSPAVVPSSPSIPNYRRNLALAVTVGLILGVGIAFLRERLDDRLASREDFQERLGAPVLGVVPKNKGLRRRRDTEITVGKYPKTPVAEAYRTIRANVQHLARDDDLKTLLVTSPMVGDGKTTVSANLAVALAQTGKRVLAVSCDLHRPRLHSFFDLGNDVGLTTVLSGKTRLADALRAVGSEPLGVLPSGPGAANAAELLASDKMAGLLTQLRETADFIILDMPPIIAVGDVLILAAKTDGVLMVADANSTTRDALVHARQQIEQVGATIVGGIFLKFDPSRARAHHAYYHYYYSGRYLQNGQSKRKGRARPARWLRSGNEKSRR